MPDIHLTEFATRRAKVMQQIGASGIAILKAAPSLHRNHYHEYPYRQNSDFYYLSGFEEPEAIIVLAPGRSEGEFILFNRPHDPAQETWDGYRVGQEGARALFGADEAFEMDTFTEKLPELLNGRDQVVYAIGADQTLDQLLFTTIDHLRLKIRNGVQFPTLFTDIRPILHEMRIIKSPAEIALMRHACEISAAAHIRAIQACRPGMYEYELEAEMTHDFLRKGARAHAYTPIIGSGANSCILHYITNNQKIKDGDLVLIDAGCEYRCYASDITRTFPANGSFTGEQRAIYEIVLAAQEAGIEAIKPGAAWNKIEETVTRILTEGLKEIGLLHGELDGLLESRAYFPFYMHRCGHWLGLDTHDAGHYRMTDGSWRKLAPNMVRTMEPGLYISDKIKGVPARWHHIGVRIEDDILVTAEGNEILSIAAPKSTDAIEELMRN